MNESISKAAGASHGQEMTESGMCRIITELGRSPLQRTTLYGQPTGRNLPDRRSIREPILIASCVT